MSLATTEYTEIKTIVKEALLELLQERSELARVLFGDNTAITKNSDGNRDSGSGDQSHAEEQTTPLLLKAQQRAEDLGLTISDYLGFLVERDLVHQDENPWHQPLPKSVIEEYDQEYEEFLQSESPASSPVTHRSAVEFLHHLNEAM